MNATDVIRLKGYYNDDIEIAEAKYAKLIAECTHVYDGGSSAIEQPKPDNTLLEPTCEACGFMVGVPGGKL